MDWLDRCVHSDEKIIIFGAGVMGELALQYFALNHRNVALIIDNDKRKWGKRIKGKRIYSPEQGVDRCPEAIYIIANCQHNIELKTQLIRMGIQEQNIVLCQNQRLLEEEIQKKSSMKYEDKNFIYDFPVERCLKKYIEIVGARVKAVGYTFLMNLYCPRKVQRKKYTVSICAIFKNESTYFKEWIEYHKIVGVQHFYLYNNFSQDNYFSILKPYIESGDVTLIEWPYEQGQISAYNDCIQRFKSESNWIGFIDLDEFVVPIDNDNIYDFLKQFEKNRGSVMIYWRLFGSSGKIERNTSGLVSEEFTVCWRKHTNIGKCFYNTAYDFVPQFKKNVVLHHRMWTKYKGKNFPPVNCFNRVCLEEGKDLAKGDHFPIQINHYFTKSLMEWDEKQQKGDVYFKQNPHNERYFLQHDMKCGAVDVSIYKYIIQLKQSLGYNRRQKR